MVGVGASAGGLEAFSELLRGLPAKPGLAIVLIQHLDPTHKSMLVELLARHTQMKVVQAADGMPVRRDCVYIIPPNAYLSIQHGVCRLKPVQAGQGARLPFNYFLVSLAEAYGARAIAVVLSGTGSDGSIGVKSVNEKGGVVIVQDPHEAVYDGMPASAIATGVTDLVLPLAKLPEALLQIGRHAYVRTAELAPASAEQGKQPLIEILNLIRQRTAHSFTFYKEGTLLRRVERRMALAGIERLDRYIDALREDPREIDALAKDMLIHVTSFFRDTEHFQFLNDRVIPDLVLEQPLNQPIRVWVPGCSTGEEAYSIHMLLLEAIAAAGRKMKLQIFATDIDSDAIAFAREGLYPESIRTEVSPARLERFFAKEDHGYRIVPQLREAILFTVHDLLTDAPFSRLDLVSCRNLLIYLRPEAQHRAIALFHFALREGGVLFLGASESIGEMTDQYQPISDVYRVYRRIKQVRSPATGFAANLSTRIHVPGPRAPLQTKPQPPSLYDAAERQLLETYVPASVLINRNFESLHYYGPIDRYLRVAPGEASRDLLAMAREGLGPKLRLAVRNARHEAEPISITGAPLKRDGKTVPVSISVQPFPYGDEPLLLVSFFDEPQPRRQRRPVIAAAGDASRIAELERDLDAAHKELESTIRDLDFSNAELTETNEKALSVNEEFQATNEELETSKEELQSLNEELTSLNSQLQETLEQQRSTANDLQNILNSSDIATLILDRNLEIRLFTPTAKALFGVMASDVGRPLADLSLRFSDNQLIDDGRAVLADLAPIRREIRASNGMWYMRRILPYSGKDGKIEGLVITYADVTEMKSVEAEIRAAHTYAENIIDTIREPLVVLDEEMQVVSVNQAFYRLIDAKPEDTLGRKLADTDAHHLDVPTLRNFVERIRTGTGNVEYIQVEVGLPRLGRRSLLMSARTILQGVPGKRKILVTLEDVTERREIEHQIDAAKRTAETANLTKSRFLATASHDLRQPLQTLRLLRGILQRRLTDRESLQLLERFRETLDAITVLLDSILDINQLEAGTIQPKIVDFPIDYLMASLKVEFAVHARAHGLDWRVMPCRLIVRSDPRLLEQMIRNLLSNAVKYTQEGRILLGCRRHGDKLRLEVWDTGPGIPESELRAIFGEFHQITGTQAQTGTGLGLGLAIVQRLGNLLGHVVDVQSRVGRGSVFSIEMPTAQAVSSEWRQREGTVPPTTTGRRGTVLIVEDDPTVREMLELLIAGEGHRTIAATNGPEAQKLIAGGATRPDVVLADYSLPGGMNGIEVIEALRGSLGQTLPVAMLTGDISTATLRKIAKHGYPHLKKPVTTVALLDLIQQLMDLPRPPTGAADPARSTEVPGAATPTIFVVDDDPGIREALRELLESEGKSVEVFDSGQAFLDIDHGDRTGCLLLDALMPGIDGLELMARLKARGSRLPVIIITGQGDVKLAVEAMKAGAVDFIEKPVEPEDLLASIERAMAGGDDAAGRDARRAAAAAQAAGLTPRQREILELVARGDANKEIAVRLGISQRTVEAHRALVMKRTGAKSLADLVRMVLAAT